MKIPGDEFKPCKQHGCKRRISIYNDSAYCYNHASMRATKDRDVALKDKPKRWHYGNPPK